MIDNAKERAALAISELQQGGEEFKRAQAIFVRSTGTAIRIAELVLEFEELINKIHENNSAINEHIYPTIELGSTAIGDLASIGISNQREEASSVMRPIGDLGIATLKTLVALSEFQDAAIEAEGLRGHTLQNAVQVGLDTMPLQLSTQDIVASIASARLSAEVFEDTL